jgi:hypothetical protein
MNSNPNLMKRYFLGAASPEERTGLENKYFADAEIFEELLAVENDLIDSYARGRLSNLEKEQFEQHYLNSPQRRVRVEFARSLTQVAQEAKQSASFEGVSFWWRLTAPLRQSRPMLRWAFVTSAVALVVASGAWLVRQNHELRSGPQPASQSELRQQLPVNNDESSLQAKKNQAAAAPEIAKLDAPVLPELTLSLNPGISRSNQAGQQVLALPSSVSSARLQLSLADDDYAGYEAVLETAEGREIQKIVGLKAHVRDGKRIVTLRLPLRLIKPGDYIVKLNAKNRSSSGEEEVEVYSFRTVRK